MTSLPNNEKITAALLASINEKKNPSWAVSEAQRILDRIENKTPEKGYVLFETGYGPSGLPHIGTFGEVVRTLFVKFAFNSIAPHIPTKLLVVSDDYDGMRKAPDNVPNPEKLKKYFGYPLTSIPDPFGSNKSYGQVMNGKLMEFLDRFGFEYEFASMTDYYKSGKFNDFLIRAAEKYQELMNIMLPTLGAERQATYSPFMPFDVESGQTLAEGVMSVNASKAVIVYEDPIGEIRETSFLNGGCKLQWKCDFGMRWGALGVDYEIFGKDHRPNAEIYQSICRTLGANPPLNYVYELFLDEEGKKISKSKGNGITIDEWLTYAPTESLSYYMYVKPETAKKLYFDVIPKATDDYISFLNQYQKQPLDEQIKNPVFYIHSGNVPAMEINISFALLLNLASACNPENEDIMWGFISKYDSNLSKGKSALLDRLVGFAIKYYEDFIKINKKYRTASDSEKNAINFIKDELKKLVVAKPDQDAIQQVIYNAAKHAEMENKDLFLALYQILLGAESGPRFGSFIALYGIENMVKLIESKL